MGTRRKKRERERQVKSIADELPCRTGGGHTYSVGSFFVVVVSSTGKKTETAV